MADKDKYYIEVKTKPQKPLKVASAEKENLSSSKTKLQQAKTDFETGMWLKMNRRLKQSTTRDDSSRSRSRRRCRHRHKKRRRSSSSTSDRRHTRKRKRIPRKSSSTSSSSGAASEKECSRQAPAQPLTSAASEKECSRPTPAQPLTMKELERSIGELDDDDPILDEILEYVGSLLQPKDGHIELDLARLSYDHIVEINRKLFTRQSKASTEAEQKAAEDEAAREKALEDESRRKAAEQEAARKKAAEEESARKEALVEEAKSAEMQAMKEELEKLKLALEQQRHETSQFARDAKAGHADSNASWQRKIWNSWPSTTWYQDQPVLTPSGSEDEAVPQRINTGHCRRKNRKCLQKLAATTTK